MVNEEQPEKVWCPKLVRVDGRRIVTSDVQCAKAESPIYVTVGGNGDVGEGCPAPEGVVVNGGYVRGYLHSRYIGAFLVSSSAVDK